MRKHRLPIFAYAPQLCKYKTSTLNVSHVNTNRLTRHYKIFHFFVEITQEGIEAMKTLFFSPLAALLLGCHLYFCGSFSGLAYASEYSHSGSLKAMCRMHPNTRLASGMPRVYGPVYFEQSGPKEKLKVTFRLYGLPVDSKQPRAMHIHEYGDLSKGCESTGGHYNPLRINHPQHPGDFGNFVPNNGKIRKSHDFNATLFGKHSIIGRSVVIHEGEDDLGRGGNVESLLNGNAGRRLACCVIGLSNPRN